MLAADPSLKTLRSFIFCHSWEESIILQFAKCLVPHSFEFYYQYQQNMLTHIKPRECCTDLGNIPSWFNTVLSQGDTVVVCPGIQQVHQPQVNCRPSTRVQQVLLPRQSQHGLLLRLLQLNCQCKTATNQNRMENMLMEVWLYGDAAGNLVSWKDIDFYKLCQELITPYFP